MVVEGGIVYSIFKSLCVLLFAMVCFLLEIALRPLLSPPGVAREVEGQFRAELPSDRSMYARMFLNSLSMDEGRVNQTSTNPSS